jgi:hypothetical protein
VRVAVVTVGLTVAVILWALGSVFDLNGRQWNWWRDGSWICALLALALSVAIAVRMPGSARRSTFAPIAGVLAGSCAAVASTIVMARRYSDPYDGPLLWPHVLACIASVGVAVVLAGVAVAVRRPR